MKTVSQAHHALGVCVTVILLAGCGGGPSSLFQPLGTAESARSDGASSAVATPNGACQGQHAFGYTGQAQQYTVPKCANERLRRAYGAGAPIPRTAVRLAQRSRVTPCETLMVMLGGQGGVGRGGGFNAGGRGAKNKTAHDAASCGATTSARVAAGWRNASSWPAEAVRQAGVATAARAEPAAAFRTGSSGTNPDCIYGHHPTSGGGGTQTSGGSGGNKNNGGSLGKGPRWPRQRLRLESGYYVRHWSGGGGGLLLRRRRRRERRRQWRGLGLRRAIRDERIVAKRRE